MKNTMTTTLPRRLLAALLTLCMMLTMLPAVTLEASAAGTYDMYGSDCIVGQIGDNNKMRATYDSGTGKLSWSCNTTGSLTYHPNSGSTQTFTDFTRFYCLAYISNATSSTNVSGTAIRPDGRDLNVGELNQTNYCSTDTTDPWIHIKEWLGGTSVANGTYLWIRVSACNSSNQLGGSSIYFWIRVDRTLIDVPSSTVPLTGVTISVGNNKPLVPGTVLTANHEPTGATVTYKWSRCLTNSGVFADITTNGNGKSYTITNDDVGYFLRCTVTGSGDTYIGSKTATATAAVGRAVTLNIQKDGEAWSDSGKTFALYQSGTEKYGLTTDGSVAGHNCVPVGTYDVYENGADTGVDLTVSATSASAEVNYYTVTFEYRSGIAEGNKAVWYEGSSKLESPAMLAEGTHTLKLKPLLGQRFISKPTIDGVTDTAITANTDGSYDVTLNVSSAATLTVQTATAAKRDDGKTVLIWSRNTKRIFGSSEGEAIDNLVARYGVRSTLCAVTKDTTRNSPLSDDCGGSLLGFDLVYLFLPDTTIENGDVALLKDYLDAGGRVVMIGENPRYAEDINPVLTSVAKELGASFQINGLETGTYTSQFSTKSLNDDSPLNDGIDENGYTSSATTQINYQPPAVWVAKAQYGSILVPWIVDQAAGENGRITVISDINFIDKARITDNTRKLLDNLLSDSRTNKTTVADGGHPNSNWGGAAVTEVTVVLDETAVTWAAKGGELNKLTKDITDKISQTYTITPKTGVSLPYSSVITHGYFIYTYGEKGENGSCSLKVVYTGATGDTETVSPAAVTSVYSGGVVTPTVPGGFALQYKKADDMWADVPAAGGIDFEQIGGTAASWTPTYRLGFMVPKDDLQINGEKVFSPVANGSGGNVTYTGETVHKVIPPSGTGYTAALYPNTNGNAYKSGAVAKMNISPAAGSVVTDVTVGGVSIKNGEKTLPAGTSFDVLVGAEGMPGVDVTAVTYEAYIGGGLTAGTGLGTGDKLSELSPTEKKTLVDKVKELIGDPDGTADERANRTTLLEMFPNLSTDGGFLAKYDDLSDEGKSEVVGQFIDTFAGGTDINSFIGSKDSASGLMSDLGGGSTLEKFAGTQGKLENSEPTAGSVASVTPGVGGGLKVAVNLGTPDNTVTPKDNTSVKVFAVDKDGNKTSVDGGYEDGVFTTTTEGLPESAAGIDVEITDENGYKLVTKTELIKTTVKAGYADGKTAPDDMGGVTAVNTDEATLNEITDSYTKLVPGAVSYVSGTDVSGEPKVNTGKPNTEQAITLTAAPKSGAYADGFYVTVSGSNTPVLITAENVVGKLGASATLSSDGKTLTYKAGEAAEKSATGVTSRYRNLLGEINAGSDNGAAIKDAIADPNFAAVFDVSSDDMGKYNALSDEDRLAVAERLEDSISGKPYDVAALKAAFVSLVGLQTVLASVDDKAEAMYTAGSWEALEDVIELAKAAIDDGDPVAPTVVDGWTSKIAATETALVTKALSVYVKVVGAPAGAYVSGAISGVISGGTETTTDAKDSFYLSPQAGKTVTITVGTKENYAASVKVDNVTTELSGNTLTLTMGSASKNVVVTYTYSGAALAPGFQGGWPTGVLNLPTAPDITGKVNGNGDYELTVTPVRSPSLGGAPTLVVVSLPGGGTAKLPMDVESDGAEGFKGVIKIPAGLLPTPLTGDVDIDPIPLVPAVVPPTEQGVETFITAINKKLENDLEINTETGIVTIKPGAVNKYFPDTVTELKNAAKAAIAEKSAPTGPDGAPAPGIISGLVEGYLGLAQQHTIAAPTGWAPVLPNDSLNVVPGASDTYYVKDGCSVTFQATGATLAEGVTYTMEGASGSQTARVNTVANTFTVRGVTGAVTGILVTGSAALAGAVPGDLGGGFLSGPTEEKSYTVTPAPGKAISGVTVTPAAGEPTTITKPGKTFLNKLITGAIEPCIKTPEGTSTTFKAVDLVTGLLVTVVINPDIDAGDTPTTAEVISVTAEKITAPADLTGVIAVDEAGTGFTVTPEGGTATAIETTGLGVEFITDQTAAPTGQAIITGLSGGTNAIDAVSETGTYRSNTQLPAAGTPVFSVQGTAQGGKPAELVITVPDGKEPAPNATISYTMGGVSHTDVPLSDLRNPATGTYQIPNVTGVIVLTGSNPATGSEGLFVDQGSAEFLAQKAALTAALTELKTALGAAKNLDSGTDMEALDGAIAAAEGIVGTEKYFAGEGYKSATEAAIVAGAKTCAALSPMLNNFSTIADVTAAVNTVTARLDAAVNGWSTVPDSVDGGGRLYNPTSGGGVGSGLEGETDTKIAVPSGQKLVITDKDGAVYVIDPATGTAQKFVPTDGGDGGTKLVQQSPIAPALPLNGITAAADPDAAGGYIVTITPETGYVLGCPDWTAETYPTSGVTITTEGEPAGNKLTISPDATPTDVDVPAPADTEPLVITDIWTGGEGRQPVVTVTTDKGVTTVIDPVSGVITKTVPGDPGTTEVFALPMAGVTVTKVGTSPDRFTLTVSPEAKKELLSPDPDGSGLIGDVTGIEIEGAERKPILGNPAIPTTGGNSGKVVLPVVTVTAPQTAVLTVETADGTLIIDPEREIATFIPEDGAAPTTKSLSESGITVTKTGPDGAGKTTYTVAIDPGTTGEGSEATSNNIAGITELEDITGVTATVLGDPTAGPGKAVDLTKDGLKIGDIPVEPGYVPYVTITTDKGVTAVIDGQKGTVTVTKGGATTTTSFDKLPGLEINKTGVQTGPAKDVYDVILSPDTVEELLGDPAGNVTGVTTDGRPEGNYVDLTGITTSLTNDSEGIEANVTESNPTYNKTTTVTVDKKTGDDVSTGSTALVAGDKLILDPAYQIDKMPGGADNWVLPDGSGYYTHTATAVVIDGKRFEVAPYNAGGNTQPVHFDAEGKVVVDVDKAVAELGVSLREVDFTDLRIITEPTNPQYVTFVSELEEVQNAVKNGTDNVPEVLGVIQRLIAQYEGSIRAATMGEYDPAVDYAQYNLTADNKSHLSGVANRLKQLREDLLAQENAQKVADKADSLYETVNAALESAPGGIDALPYTDAANGGDRAEIARRQTEIESLLTAYDALPLSEKAAVPAETRQQLDELRGALDAVLQEHMTLTQAAEEKVSAAETVLEDGNAAGADLKELLTDYGDASDAAQKTALLTQIGSKLDELERAIDEAQTAIDEAAAAEPTAAERSRLTGLQERLDKLGVELGGEDGEGGIRGKLAGDFAQQYLRKITSIAGGVAGSYDPITNRLDKTGPALKETSGYIDAVDGAAKAYFDQPTSVRDLIDQRFSAPTVAELFAETFPGAAGPEETANRQQVYDALRDDDATLVEGFKTNYIDPTELAAIPEGGSHGADFYAKDLRAWASSIAGSRAAYDKLTDESKIEVNRKLVGDNYKDTSVATLVTNGIPGDTPMEALCADADKIVAEYAGGFIEEHLLTDGSEIAPDGGNILKTAAADPARARVWALADGDAAPWNELSAAEQAAVDARMASYGGRGYTDLLKQAAQSYLTEAFKGYKPTDYSDGEWKALCDIKDEGMSAIRQAQTAEEIQAILGRALEGMKTAPQPYVQPAVRGLVLDADGNPVAGATVKVALKDSTGNSRTYTYTTDRTGAYALTGVRTAEGSYTLYASKDGVGCGSAAIYTNGTGDSDPLDLTLSPTIETIVGGIVTTASPLNKNGMAIPSGGALAGYNVTVVNKADGTTVTPGAGSTLRTTTGGGYVLENLPAGTYIIKCENGLTSGITELTVATDENGFTAAPSGDYNTANLSMRPGKVVSGAVTGLAEGETATVSVTVPVYTQTTNGALVEVGTKIAKVTATGSEGKYYLPGVMDGSYTVTAVTNDGRSISVTDEGSADGFDALTMPAASTQEAPVPVTGALAGAVIDEEGKALVGATVTLFDQTGAKVGESKTTTAGGGYSFTGLDTSKTYTVAVSGSDGSPASGVNTVPVAFDPRTGLVDTGSGNVQANTGSAGTVGKALVGKVTDNSATPAPVAGARVVVTDTAGKVVGTATTNENGSYFIPNVPTGSTVSISDSRGNTAKITATTEGAESGLLATDTPAQLTPPATTALTIIGADGGLLQGAAVTFRQGDTVIPTATTDDNGQTVLPADGAYQVAITKNGLAQTYTVTVTGGTVRPNLLTIGSATVSGQARLPGGSIPRQAVMTLKGEDGTVIAQADAGLNTGAFTIPRVPSGAYTYELAAIDPEDSGRTVTTTGTVTVADGRVTYTTAAGASVSGGGTLTCDKSASVAALENAIRALPLSQTGAALTAAQKNSLLSVLQTIKGMTTQEKAQIDADLLGSLSLLTAQLATFSGTVQANDVTVSNGSSIQEQIAETAPLVAESETIHTDASTDVSLLVRIDNATENQPDSALVEAAVMQQSLDKEVHIGMYLDISVLKTVTTSTVVGTQEDVETSTEFVEALPRPVTITIDLPEELRSYLYFNVLVVHNGLTYRLPCAVRNGRITFDASLFSTYAVLYSMEPIFGDELAATTTSSGRRPVKAPVLHRIFVEGYTDGTFRPEGTLTRAEALLMLARMYEDFDKNGVYPTSLSDVPADAWYAAAVGFLEEKGPLTGYPDATCRPRNTITRAEFCTIMARYLGLENVGESAFADVRGSWAEGFCAQLAMLGVLEGYDDGTFRPNAKITRAEAVKIMCHVFGRVPDGEVIAAADPEPALIFPDVTKAHWAYWYILESSQEHDEADFH